MRVLLANISQLKSDIQSCQCKTFSLKQASGLIGRSGGLDPLDTPPGSTTETYQNLSGFVTSMSNRSQSSKAKPAKELWLLKFGLIYMQSFQSDNSPKRILLMTYIILKYK